MVHTKKATRLGDVRKTYETLKSFYVIAVNNAKIFFVNLETSPDEEARHL